MLGLRVEELWKSETIYRQIVRLRLSTGRRFHEMYDVWLISKSYNARRHRSQQTDLSSASSIGIPCLGIEANMTC